MDMKLSLPEKLPSRMMLEVTKRCNYQCPYCYCVWHEVPGSVGAELDTAEWKRLIRACVRKGVKSILFSGGEALIRGDIRELLDHAVHLDSNLKVSLFTNGSLMDETMFLFCKENRIAVSTSLQGLRTHGTMTGTDSGFRKTLELILMGHEENWPVAVSITVTRENRTEIRDVFAAAALCGSGFIQLGAMMPEGRGRDHPEWVLSCEEWESVKKEIRTMKDCGVPYVFCNEMICTCRDHTPEIASLFPESNRKTCKAGIDFGVIGPDGNYRKCLHSLPAG